MQYPFTCEVTASPADGPAEDALQGLVLRLVEDMAAAWHQGERLTAEEYLDRFANLKERLEAALPLVCEELCLREEFGQREADTELPERFRPWRAEVERMLVRHRRDRADQEGPGFPAAGEAWSDFQLVAELGRGAMGRVFLATQPALANRPVVLKVSTRDAREHLSLARLQHTHIVPLYAVHDDAGRNLRALCMPYFGGTSLDEILETLRTKPPGQRTGADVLAALDQFQARSPIPMPTRGPARTLMSKATYPQAVCIIGACLAEALKYAHERGLVHLDLKPANVLLAADGQPMLLDFHLARAPLRAGAAPPEWFGGTPQYMSPEQRQATAAVKERRTDFPAVDGRSDVFSLGLTLYSALAGDVPAQPEYSLPRLDECNPLVTTGLADIIHRCLAPQPERRYQDAGALAADLNRYLSNKPLLGVANRSWLERWRKWNLREPHGLARAGMFGGVLIALLMGVQLVGNQLGQRRQAAEESLAAAQDQLRRHQYPEALHSLGQGLQKAQALWWGGEELAQRLREEAAAVQRAQAAHTLHHLVDRVRFLFGTTNLPEAEMRALEESCRKVWDVRNALRGEGGVATDPRVRTDLLDLVLLWTDLRVGLAAGGGEVAARREAVEVLDEAEKLFGRHAALRYERRRHAEAAGLPPVSTAADPEPRSAGEHFALGRSLWKAGDLTGAARALEQAVALQPDGFWPNFYRGACDYRAGRFDVAARAFCVCVALRPQSAECYFNRALAYRELGEHDNALSDLGRALRLDARLGCAALNRGVLHLQHGRYAEAQADLEHALRNGVSPVEAHYNLAWLHHKQNDPSRARTHLAEVLRRAPQHTEALALDQVLRGNQ